MIEYKKLMNGELHSIELVFDSEDMREMLVHLGYSGMGLEAHNAVIEQPNHSVLLEEKKLIIRLCPAEK